MTREELEMFVDSIISVRAAATDEQALDAMGIYPVWRTGTKYAADTRLRYGNKLYRVLQAHTSQGDWTPDITPALYAEIAKPGSGTIDDPIPYSGNMELEEGLYYTQNGVEYLCTRDTGVPVYNALADLVGIYVEIVPESEG